MRAPLNEPAHPPLPVASRAPLVARIAALQPTAWLAIAIAAIGVLVWRFIETFRAPWSTVSSNFGTAAAPYSDALGPWLEGGLTFLMGLPARVYLYRPTVGVFWSAILATTGRVEMIPIFFCCWLLVVVVGALMLSRNGAVRSALIMWLALGAICFEQTWDTLNPATTNVDLAACVLTLSGVVLLLLDGRDAKRATSELMVGALSLGIAAAIRGPMLLGGAMMILMRGFVITRAPIRLVALAALLFAFPMIVEVALQRHLGVVNNGLLSLFCMYTSDAHTWARACHNEYLAQRPTLAEVLRGYAGFAFSDAGLQYFVSAATWRAARDLAVLQQPEMLAFIAAAGLLGPIFSASGDSTGDASRFHARDVHRRIVRWVPNGQSWWLRSALMVGSLLVAKLSAASYTWSGLAWVAAIATAAVALRLWRSVLCVAGYIGGTLFLCLTGLYFVDRLQGTFSFTLYLAIGLLLAETRLTRVAIAGDRRFTTAPLTVAVLLAVVFLYTANLVVPSELSVVYRRDVYTKPGIAMKISDDARVDRSLYLTGDRRLFYTTHDELSVGSVRRFRNLASEAHVGNDSFLHPNAFVE